MQTQVRSRRQAHVLEISLDLFADRVVLRLDLAACLKCDICATVCPQQAVTIIAGDHDLDITIDPRRCLLCEVCAHFCPTGAITLTYNGQPKTILADNRALAPFLPKITVDPDRCPEPCRTQPAGEVHWCRHELRLVDNLITGCPKSCHRCLDACPRQAIGLDQASDKVVADPGLCLRCSQCLTVCRFGSLEVSPQFLGQVRIDDRRCPPDCNKCIALCPVQAIVREGARVYLRHEQCSLCGVCRNICDQEAITLVREEVLATDGDFSHAWQQATARLVTDAED